MKNLKMPNSKRTKQRAFAILIALLMMVSFIANVGAVVEDLAPPTAKPGDIIDILSWNIIGPEDGTTLTSVTIYYDGTDPADIKYTQILVDDTIFGTYYGEFQVPGEIPGIYPILETEIVTVTLRFKLEDDATHGNMVDGKVIAYTTILEGATGTDSAPIIQPGYTIIDNVKPTALSVTADPDPAKAGPVTITVEFSEAMDMGVGPAVQVTGLISGPYTVTGGFLDPDTWEGELTISGDPAEVATATISVSGGEDLAGNVMVPGEGSFQVDTVSPNVVSITASDPKITDDDFSNWFEVTVTFDEDMDMLVDPTVSFTPDVTATLPSLIGSWTDGTHYVIRCLIADGNQEVKHVSVSVSGAQDIAGNPHGSVGLMHLFAIDNKNPTVDISVSDNMISDPDVPGPFKVTATFSEAMDKSVPPAVSFTPNVDLILTSTGGAWDVDGMVYTATYTITHDNVEVTGVDVTVSGAQDLAGNSLVSKTEANLFNIDMIAPLAPEIFKVPPYINIDNQFTYPVEGLAEPGSTVEVMLTDVFFGIATNTGPADPFFYIIEVDASFLLDGPVFVNARATDAAGNTGPWSDPIIPVTKDTIAPIVSITIADPINIDNVADVPVTITSNEIGNYVYVISDGVVTHDVTGSGGITPVFPVDLNLDLQTLDDGTITAYVYVLDTAGNVGEAGDTATKDTVEPMVFNCQFSDILISEADADGVFTVTVTYNEPMDSAFYPDITFNPTTPGTLIFSSEAWNSDTVYTRTYTIKDVDEEVTVYVHIIGGSDLVGNTQVPFTASQGIDIDTIAPTPYMVYISLIDDADGNGIANIGDTLRVEADMTLHPDTASITADLHHYGGSETKALDPINGAWTVDFVIVDSPTGIDVGDYDPLSAVTVTATDNVGNTATATSDPLISMHGVDSLAPEPLTGLTATAIADGKIRLDWTASVAPDLASYIIYRDVNMNPGTEIATVGPVESWIDEDSLLDGETYHYRMKSVDDADNIGDYSDEYSATSDSTPPDAPTDLDAPDYINIANQHNYPVSGTAEHGSTVDVRLANRPLPKIDGIIDAVEWDGALTIPVAKDMGTVKVLATKDYLYMLFEVMDSTDARLGENSVGNDKIGININPTDGEQPLYGKPYDIVFQIGADPAAFTTVPPGGVSSGMSDGWYTEWVIEGEQLDLPLDLETKTIYIYAEGMRISELKVPLATIDLLPGNTIKIGGACDNLHLPGGAQGNSYLYPPDLEWHVASTYEDITLLKTVTGQGPAAGAFNIPVDAQILDDGTVYIDSRATDTVGNTGPWSDPITVTKDTVAPTVTINIPEYINFDDVGIVEVTITSNEDGTYFYAISDTVTALQDNGPITAGLPVEFTLDLSSLNDGTITADASVVDAAGNPGDAQRDTATKDTEVPIVAILIPEYVNLANVAEFPVTITSDEAGMYNYIISDGVINVEGGKAISAGETLVLKINLVTLADSSIYADVWVKDAAGNVGHAQDTATKDTDAPIVTGVTANPILLTDLEEGLEFTVTVDYSEAMKEVTPTITFNPTVDSTLTPADGIWTDADTYTATYTVADGGVKEDDVDILVEGVEDLAGNVQDAYTKSDAFDIDTENPTVTDLDISDDDDWIREEDILDPFTVTVTFSEAMDKSVYPVISFSPDVSTTLPSPIGDWTSDTVYKATYTIADVNEEKSNVIVSVSGAEDLVGNLQEPYSAEEEDWFAVDTLHGTSEPTSIEVKAKGEDDYQAIIVDDVPIKATVWNWFNEKISGVEVSFATDLGTIYPLKVPTAGGSAETSISSEKIGKATVTATVTAIDGIVSDSCTITFVEQTLVIDLSLGWNLVSVPRTLAVPAIEEVFDGITTVEKVYTYYEGEWYAAFYDGEVWEIPIQDHRVDNIVDGKGYWVYTSEPTTITIKLKPLGYMETPPSYPLPAKWSLIGYTSIQLNERMLVDTYLGYLSWNTLYRFDPDEGYEITKPISSWSWFDKYFKTFELGRGYWIHLNEAGDLVP